MPSVDTPSLAGTWSYTTIGYSSPELTGFFHFTEDLRYVSVEKHGNVISEKNPEAWLHLRYHFAFEPQGILRIKPPRGNSEGWLHHYRFEGSKLWMRRDNIAPMEWICEKVAVDSIPAWFTEQLAKALDRPWG
jgi:hypothetical protein